jgi:hypothetical protein
MVHICEYNYLKKLQDPILRGDLTMKINIDAVLFYWW